MKQLAAAYKLISAFYDHINGALCGDHPEAARVEAWLREYEAGVSTLCADYHPQTACRWYVIICGTHPETKVSGGYLSTPRDAAKKFAEAHLPGYKVAHTGQQITSSRWRFAAVNSDRTHTTRIWVEVL